MPAIETLPVTVNDRPDLKGTSRKSSAPTADGFEQAMQHALEPSQKKVTEKNATDGERKNDASALAEKKKKLNAAKESLPDASLAIVALLVPVSPVPEPVLPKLPMGEVGTGKNQSLTEVSPVAIDPLATLTGMDKKIILEKTPANTLTVSPVVADKKSPAIDLTAVKNPTEKNIETQLSPSLLGENVVVEVAPVVLSDPEIMPKADAMDEVAAPIQGKDKLNSDRSKTTPLAAVNSGTGVASIPIAMKNSDKMEFFAGSDGQKLPGAGPTRLAEEGLSAFLKNLPNQLPEKNAPELSVPLTAVDNFSVSSAATTTTVNILAAPTDARMQLVERTHDLISAHALRVQEAKTDSMSVVLKPDSGTELSLQLRQKDGVVEAQAMLSQGDHQLLNQHWADLQARLELRGIKLSPLGGEGTLNSGNFSSENGGQQRSPTREETADHAAAFAEFAAITGGASARLATSVRGWESWA